MAIQTNKDGSLGISGELTFDSVPGLFAQTASVLSGDIDLSGISSVDSAGLALLLEWQATARSRGDRLAFINAPSDLRRLAALSEATGLLGLTAGTDKGGEQ